MTEPAGGAVCAPGWAAEAGRWLRRAAAVARAVIGVPDYERYLAHMRTHHPDRVPLTRAEHLRETVERRQRQPGTRCC